MTIKTSGPRPSDKFIPYYFVIFFILFAVLLFWFARIAISTNTGVISENAYNDGLAYNKTIAAAEEQEKLGWKATIIFENEMIGFYLLDDKNKPITDAEVTAFFIRPTSSGHDKEIKLTPDGKGNYSAKPALELKGVWDITILSSYKGHNYQQHQRFMIK